MTRRAIASRLAAACGLLSACGKPKLKLVEADQAAEPSRPARPADAALASSDKTAEKTDTIYTSLDWRVLRGLNTRTGELSSGLRKLEGGAVKISGYMVPFEDEFDSAREFLLVPQAGMCVHLPPPPANQMLLVEMTGEPARVVWRGPVLVSGILEIVQSDSPYGKVAFKIEAASAVESE